MTQGLFLRKTARIVDFSEVGALYGEDGIVFGTVDKETSTRTIRRIIKNSWIREKISEQYITSRT